MLILGQEVMCGVVAATIILRAAAGYTSCLIGLMDYIILPCNSVVKLMKSQPMGKKNLNFFDN